MSARDSEIERELRARIKRDAPPAIVLELFGEREEHNHVRGCAIRAGSHAYPCTCRELVAADIATRRNVKRTGYSGYVELSADAEDGIRQTIRDLEARLERICTRVDDEVRSYSEDENARELWLARGEISQAATMVERHNAEAAKVKLRLAAQRMDLFESGEQDRAEQAALARFRRQGA